MKKNRRFLMFIAGLVVVAQLVLCICPVAAASGCVARLTDKVEPITLPFPVEVTFKADGSWTLGLFDSGITVSSAFLATVGGMFGQVVPEATAGQIGFFVANNIQHIVLAADAGQVKTWVNGRMMPEIQVSPALVGLLAENGFKANLLEFALRLQGRVYIRFPVAPSVNEIPMPENLETEVAASTELAVNFIKAGFTVSPDGKIVSIAGFTVEELLAFGFEPPMPQTVEQIPMIAPQAMKAIGSDVGLEVSADGVLLGFSGEVIVRVAWDKPSRAAGLKLVETLTGIKPERGVAERLEKWLATTHLSAGVHVAEKPVESLPAIKLQKPLTIEYTADGSWRIEGLGPEDFGYKSFKIRPEVLEQLTAANIQHIQAYWVGGKIHFAVNGQPLPVVELGNGWWPQAFKLAGYEAIPEDGKVEQMLSGFQVPVVVHFPVIGSAKPVGPAESWTYEPTTTMPAITAEVTATLDRNGHFELGRIQVPGLGQIQVPVGINLAWVPSPVAPSELMASIGPNGLAIQADEINYAVHWDAATLATASTLADAFGWGATARQIAGVASTVAITATVQVEVPPVVP